MVNSETIQTSIGNKRVDLLINKMPNETETAPNAWEKYRKAQALIVEHLDLSPQDVDATKKFNL